LDQITSVLNRPLIVSASALLYELQTPPTEGSQVSLKHARSGRVL
jgi:hypothetical protein